MISPKYALSHYFFKPSENRFKAPNVVNLYLDYNCKFSAKLFLKLIKVIPQLEEKYPGKFQFVFVNIVQPWHPTSVLLHEYSLVAADVLRKNDPDSSNKQFWAISEAIFRNKETFFDTSTVSLSRNDIYKLISSVVLDEVQISAEDSEILDALEIQEETDPAKAANSGNAATIDLKYFTRYTRTVGVHVTPTVSVNGIFDNSVSSGLSEEELVNVFEAYAK